MPSLGKGNNCQLWDDCLKYISLRAKKASFNTWFKRTRGLIDDKQKLVIFVPNKFVADWLSGRYHDLVSEAITQVKGTPLDFHFELMSCSEADSQQEIEFDPKPVPGGRSNGGDRNLNERYRFDSMVVGNFNQFAHAAAVAVAEAPGKTNYNPLFIYGGSGLGKTHLTQAIGHYIYENYPQKRVMYATSEKFTSDFITAVTGGTISSFTAQYRNVDVLLIDDIQFFSGKESTQEQLFHTFNDLQQYGKQIVLTSDRHPHETKGLEERLLSRFSSGLVADLQSPDIETRIAILKKRTEREGVELPQDVLEFIANNVVTNIRTLEGALTRLLAYASMDKKPITLDFAVRVLGKDIVRPRKELTIIEIQKRTAEFFRIDPLMMTAKKKSAEIALARQVAMYLTRKHMTCSLKTIGEAFGGRDHSTVIHACDLVESKLASDFDFREKLNNLAAILLSRDVSKM